MRIFSLFSRIWLKFSNFAFAEIAYQEMLDKTQEAEKYRIISDGLENKLKDFIRNNNKSSENLEKNSLNKQKDVETSKYRRPSFNEPLTITNLANW